MMVFEYAGAVRTIYMETNGGACRQLDGLVQRQLGRRNARRRHHGVQRQTWFDRAGNFHSDALHVVERITATDRII